MFVTIERVKELTDYDVTSAEIGRAQGLIEAYVGRLEVEVVDASDQVLLERATAYQTAYMQSDPIKVFEQIPVHQIGQFGATVTFKQGDLTSPYISGMARLACEKLSWRRMRSVKVGSMYGPAPVPDWRTD
jgi:hypothetical protein